MASVFYGETFFACGLNGQYTNGCGGDPPQTCQAAPQANGNPQFITDPTQLAQCCSGNNAINPPPPSCPGAGSSGNGTLPPFGNLLTELQNAEQSLQAAASEVSASPLPSGLGSPLINTGTGAAASSGGFVPSTSGGVVSSQLPIGPGAGVPQGGGGGSGGGMGGMGGSGLSQAATANASPAPSVSANSGLGTGNGSIYQSGGGKGKKAGASAGKSFFGLFGNFENQDGNGSAGMISFGQNGDSGVNPMRDPDPEDYFTRINLDESLFKKVHDEYMVVAGKWSMEH